MAASPPPPPPALPSKDELLAECNALVLYVARHGDILGSEETIRKAYDSLAEAVVDKDANDVTNWPELKKHYATVTAQTKAAAGINGRSILDTLTFGTGTFDPSEIWWKKCLRWLNPGNLAVAFHGPRRPMAIGLLLFLLALFLQAAIGWAGRVSDPVKDLQQGCLICYWLIRDLAPLLLAGLWGGIGSCLFLMKKLSDRLSSMTYEKSRQKGDLARIFVGAFLGIAVVELVIGDLGDAMMVGDVNLTPNLVALAAGVATKAVYGILETAIEGVAARISGGKGKSQ